MHVLARRAAIQYLKDVWFIPGCVCYSDVGVIKLLRFGCVVSRRPGPTRRNKDCNISEEDTIVCRIEEGGGASRKNILYMLGHNIKG